MSERAYLRLMNDILNIGDHRPDRTGVGTYGIFGPQVVYDLRQGFPLFTTKRVWLKGIIVELLWMLSGDTNVKTLQAQGVHIWDEWASETGDLGPVYGAQWRHWNAGVLNTALDPYRDQGDAWVPGRDQLKELVDGLKRDPYGRRHIVTAWNPDEISAQRLPPCHCFFQCYVNLCGELSLILHQRSADMFLGVPYNVASYSLLTMMLAQVTGLKPGRFIHNLGDAHIYTSHVQAVTLQLSRMPRKPPTMKLDSSVDNLFKFTYDSFTIEGYDPYDKITAPVAV